MTSIDLDQLALVTGGRGGCQQQQQQVQQQDPQQQQAAQDDGAQPQQGGNFLAGLDQFLSFFQTDSFQQLLGGIRGIIGQFAGGQQQQQQQA